LNDEVSRLGPPAGLGTTKDEVRKYLGDSTNPLRVAFEKVAERGPGNPSVASDTPRIAGRFTVVSPDDDRITDNVSNTVKDERDDYPGHDERPSHPARDRSREAQTGNSIGYTVRRLEREAKDDHFAAVILARLRAGEITANAAAVLAGHRLRSITIPADPRAAARRLVRHFTREQFGEMVDAAAFPSRSSRAIMSTRDRSIPGGLGTPRRRIERRGRRRPPMARGWDLR